MCAVGMGTIHRITIVRVQESFRKRIKATAAVAACNEDKVSCAAVCILRNLKTQMKLHVRSQKIPSGLAEFCKSTRPGLGDGPYAPNDFTETRRSLDRLSPGERDGQEGQTWFLDTG